MDLDGLGLEPWEVLLVRRMPKKQFYRLFYQIKTISCSFSWASIIKSVIFSLDIFFVNIVTQEYQ